MKKSFVSLAVLLVVCIGIVAGTPKVAHAQTILIDIAADMPDSIWGIIDGNEEFSTLPGAGLKGKITLTQNQTGDIYLDFKAEGVPNDTGKKVVWDSSDFPIPYYLVLEYPFAGIWYTYDWEISISSKGKLKMEAKFDDSGFMW